MIQLAELVGKTGCDSPLTNVGSVGEGAGTAAAGLANTADASMTITSAAKRRAPVCPDLVMPIAFVISLATRSGPRLRGYDTTLRGVNG